MARSCFHSIPRHVWEVKFILVSCLLSDRSSELIELIFSEPSIGLPRGWSEGVRGVDKAMEVVRPDIMIEAKNLLSIDLVLVTSMMANVIRWL